MKLKVKIMPAVMTFLSALYFIYVVSSEDTVLAADAVGGDPGGKVLPMAMAVFMFIGFLYITIKERPDGKAMDSDTKKLFILTLILSILYVLLIKSVGFIILSSLLLYCLEYIFTTFDEKVDRKQAVLGGIGTVAATVAVYFVMRLITKCLMNWGRTGVLPEVFSTTVCAGCISLVLIAVVVAVLLRTVCRNLSKEGMAKISNSFIITLTTVLFLFVVFKQFFNVSLAQGILRF